MAKARPRVDVGRFFRPSEETNDIDFLMKVPDEETAQRATELNLPLKYLPLANIAPDPHQLRRLPHPHELQALANEGDLSAVALLEGLHELGHSILDHGQLQPAIVYADYDPENEQVSHRLLHGQRRWSAAILKEIPTLWVVEVSEPTRVQRVLRQFDENERREGLTDMERAWALKALKEALETDAGDDVTWNVIEEHMRISEPRRKDLLRLLRFCEMGQNIILRYGWSEWTLRVLHKSIHAEEITQDDALIILQTLAQKEAVNAPVVATVVKEYMQQKNQLSPSEEEQQPETSPDQIISRKGHDTIRRMSRVRTTINQFRSDILASVTDDDVRTSLRQEAEELRSSLEVLLQELEQHQ